MKREADGDMGAPYKRSRRGDEEVRILIPSKVAGAIIGKGGQNISKLRSQYKASITVPDCPGPERMLSLSSDLDTICNIINDVIPCLEENGGRTGGDDLDLRMMIHQSQAGCIIGKGGTKIKEIRDQIGTKIKIFSNCAPHSTDRVIQIIGSPDKCIETVKEILTLVKLSPIKGAVNPYDPHNFDEFYAEEYGGFGSGSTPRAGGPSGGPRGAGGRGGGISGSTGTGNRPLTNMGNRSLGGGGVGGGGANFNNRAAGPQTRRSGGGPGAFGGGGVGGGGGMSGGRFSDRGGSLGGPPVPSRGFGNNDNRGFSGPPPRPSGGNSFGRNSNWNSPMNNRGGGSQPPTTNLMSSGGRMGGGGGTRMNQQSPMGGGSSQNGPGKNSTQVTIPKDLAGAIIGKGGGRIRKIRADSGAGITIDEPLPGSNDRIITITGSPNQIQMAQYLLQQSVHNNTDNRNY